MECNKCQNSPVDSTEHYNYSTVFCRRNKKDVQTTTALICKAYDFPLQTTTPDRRSKKVKK